MAENNEKLVPIKVSDFTEATTLNGSFSIGVDKDGKSVKFPIELLRGNKGDKGDPGEVTTEQLNTLDSKKADKTDLEGNEVVYAPNGEIPLFPFHIIQNNEYLYAIEDNGTGKILGGIRWNGTHVIPKGVPRDAQVKFKEIALALENLGESINEIADFKTLFNSIFMIAPDDSNNLYKMFDKKGKLLAKISADGTIIPTKLKLTRENISQIEELISTAINESVIGNTIVDNKKIYQLPFPERAVTINIKADRFPVSKTDEIKAIFQYADYMGNRFEDTCTLSGQGNSSTGSERISIAVDFDNIKVSFGSMPLQDSFHIKSYVWDKFRGGCVWAYDYATEVRNTLPFGSRYPNDYLKIHTDAIGGGNGILENELPSGANFNSRGFPARVYLNGVFKGMYCPIYKKDRANYEQKKDNANHIHLDGELNATTFWNGSIDWSIFEVRNPKGLLDIDGVKYNGDAPKELSDTDIFTKSVKEKVIRLSNAIPDIKANPTKAKFDEYFLPIPMIDYLIRSNVCYNYDGFSKNWQWLTWDGLRFGVSDHDWDTLFGMYFLGTFVIKNSTTNILGTSTSLPTGQLIKFYKPEIEARYKELRDNGILSVEYITNSLKKWMDKVGYDNYKEDFDLYPNTPSNRDSGLNSEYWELVGNTYDAVTYDAAKSYIVGDTAIWGVSQKYVFKCVKAHTNQPPTKILYPTYPQQLGFRESLWRVNTWLKDRFIATDNYFNYNK